MTLSVGVVGCGEISSVYFANSALFRDVDFVACADIVPEAARRRADEFGVQCLAVRDLFAREDIDAVLNLTVPAAHAEVSLAALEAGKHVYSEKPLATTLADGLKIIEMARAKGLRVGAAPDTVLGAACQSARRAIDAGRIGRPLSAFAAVLSHGMERWHPNPAFYFRKGGGPVFDMGPYYISALATLLGPVSAVQAIGQIGFAERTITAADSKFRGETIRVETFTSVQALLEFASGAQATFLASWDVWKNGLPPIEIHGEKGSLSIPDPNWFSGRVELAEGDADAVNFHSPTRLWRARTIRRGTLCSPITAASASPKWRARSTRAGRTAPAQRWRCTRSRSWRGCSSRGRGASSRHRGWRASGRRRSKPMRRGAC